MGQTESMRGKNREKMIRRKEKKKTTLTLECRKKSGEVEEIGSKVWEGR